MGESESNGVGEAGIGQHIFVDEDDEGAEHNPEQDIPAGENQSIHSPRRWVC